MRIKVITGKDIIKYLAKISLIFGIIAIFANFFYTKKNVNSYFSFDSRKFLGMIKNEILMMKNDNSNLKLGDKNYISDTIGSEFSLFKLVDVTNPNGLVYGNVNYNGLNGFQNIENNKENESSDIDLQESVDNADSQNQNNQENDANNNANDTNMAENEELQDVQTGVNVEILPSSIPDKATCEIFGVKLRDECDYDLQSEIKDLNVDINKNDIIIFHTHTCESYTPTEQCQYNSSGNYRTTDLNYSVSRVGDELEKYLKKYGFNIVHDKSYHDYPSYNGSYNRSLVTVQNLLNQYTNTDVVIDLHRDAIGDNTYAPKVKIGDDCCARVMFVIGTDGGGLYHKNWRDNLKFAMKIVKKGNELYPGLFKPIIVRNSRYNHHLAKAACIIEVGATGNTLEECLNSMKYLAKIYSEVE